MLQLLLTARRAALPAVLALAAGAITASPAHADAAPTPQSVADQLGGAFAASDVRSLQRSPDGVHVLYRRAERVAAATDGTSDECSDLWVMRTTGTESTRLTNTCSASGGSAAPFTTGEQWSPDGAITAFGGSGMTHATGRSTRWTLTPGSAATESWSAQSFAGAGVGYTADGRFWIMQSQDWQYGSTTWSAVRVATGAEHAVWAELRRGAGAWSALCATAPMPAAAPLAPGYDEVLAALSGPAPDCRFAAPVETPEPTPPIMGWGPRAGTAPEPTAAPAATTASAPVASGRTQQPIFETSTDALRVRATTSNLATIARRGSLTLRIDAPGARSVRAWVILAAPLPASGSEGRALRAGTTIARGRLDGVRAGATSLRLPVGTAARRALRRATTVRATVRVVSTDAAGEVTTSERPLLLRR